jgi:hypothetical protein
LSYRLHPAAFGVAFALISTLWLSWPVSAPRGKPLLAARTEPAQAIAANLGVAPAQSMAAGSEMQEGVAMYRQGRWSHAFGKFLGLANDGDPDAAHMALFMSRYGPFLYGSDWESHPDAIQEWSRLIVDRAGQRLAVFVPDPYELGPAGDGSRQPAADDAQLAAAAQLFRDARFGVAFDVFRQLAAQADRDAAHIALFMDKYGPLLFGSHWGVESGELAEWARLVTQPVPRRRLAPPSH